MRYNEALWEYEDDDLQSATRQALGVFRFFAYRLEVDLRSTATNCYFGFEVDFCTHQYERDCQMAPDVCLEPYATVPAPVVNSLKRLEPAN